MRPKRHIARSNSLRSSAGRRSAAFTVTELMLAVSIMGVIVFSLYSVFNQTQKALRSTQTQGDVAEKARAIVDMISRELQQAHATFSGVPGTNENNLIGGFEYAARVQRPERTDVQPRTNFLQNIFFYTHHTNAWQAIGYRVVNVTNGVGSLVRFETNHFGSKPFTNRLSKAFINEPRTNLTYHPIADGVIHLAFIPYDERGYRLGYDTTNRSPNLKILRKTTSTTLVPFSDTTLTNKANVLLFQGDPAARSETLQYGTSFAFQSNALPSYVDMEFGILEPETLSQYYTMLQDNNPNASKFLEKQVGKVHLFRQRIPIRASAQ
jgi:hypothetical protein